MSANSIEIYEGNAKRVTCTVTGISSLAGYTPTFTAKVTRDSDTVVITKEGSISDLDIIFDLEAEDTEVTPRIYYYDITIVNGDIVYTVTQDVLEIKKSVRY